MLILSTAAAPLFTLFLNIASLRFSSWKAQTALIGHLPQAWAGTAHHVSISALLVFLQPTVMLSQYL